MKRPLCVVCLAFVVSIGILMQLFKLPTYSLEEKNGTFAKLQGTVVKKQRKEQTVTLYLSNVAFCDENNSPIIKGVVCYSKQPTEEQKEPKIGSVIQVEGVVEEFKVATNPGEFNQRNYQRIEGFEFCCKNTTIVKESVSYDKKKEWLDQVKKQLSQSIEHNFSTKNAGVIQAMLLGEKQELELDVKKLYQRNGISHILAISGLHIGILGMGLYQLLKKLRLPLIVASVISVVFMYQYGNMTGMSSSCFRAIFMFALHLFATMHKRSYDMITAMAIAAVLLLVRFPFYIYQVGFLLSFGAIMGIGLVQPVISHYMKCNQVLSASLSVNFITLPILLFYFYECSLYSIFLNLIVIPCMGAVILLGSVVALTGLFLDGISKIASVPAELILNVYEKLCLLIDYVPYQTLVLGKPSPWQIIIYYALLFLLVFFYKKIGYKIALGIIFVAVFLLVLRMQSGLSITFLDVGQGDGACIEAPNREVYLIDAGSSTKQKLAEQQLIPFLKSRGYANIDYVFLSHMDEDHISGIRQLLELREEKQTNIRIRRMVVPYVIKEDPKWKEMQLLAMKQGVLLYYMKAGEQVQNGRLSIQCIAPEETNGLEDSNENSMVLSVTYGEFDVLFTGDIEGKGEEALVKELERKNKLELLKDYEILKVAHHGSKNAGTKKLLDLINAETAIISCGKNNSYGHPHQEAIKRLEEAEISWCSTQDKGAITITTDGKKWRQKYVIESF